MNVPSVPIFPQWAGFRIIMSDATPGLAHFRATTPLAVVCGETGVLARPPLAQPPRGFVWSGHSCPLPLTLILPHSGGASQARGEAALYSPQPGKARIGGASVVERLQDWLWSSFHHYLTGEEGAVEIESHWTATRRKNQGSYPTVRRRDPA